ncbi:hypothetical protein [Microbacterium gubbeenense]|uniref:hypothetical protein n=1 Tax=Microbacteriaceae TaxID=85023 RepID=UPI003F9B175E
MSSSAPTAATLWEPLDPRATAGLVAAVPTRWWLSGGAALDRWLGGTSGTGRTPM